MTRLTTSRLIIDELQTTDAAFTVEMLNDKDFLSNIGDRDIATLEQAEQYLLNGPIASYREHGFGMFAVRLKSSGEAIGMCGLVNREGLDDIDIGYAFLPAGRGQGYALEAARRVMQLATEELALARLIAIVSPGNDSSEALLQKLGMSFETTTFLPNDDTELRLYAWQRSS